MMSFEYYFVCNNSFIGKVVHHKDCRYLRNHQKKFLGSFPDYPRAVVTALEHDSETDQCQACLEQQYKTTASLNTKPAKKMLLTDKNGKSLYLKEPGPDSKGKATAYINRVPRKHS